MRVALTAYSSPWRMALVVLGSIVFVALGLWMVGLFGEVPENRRWSREFVQIFGWISIIFFGLCAIVGTRRALDSDAQLRISASGIYWKPWSEVTIPWHEVREVSGWRYRRQKFILLSLNHPERYPSSSLLGKLAAANRALAGGDISISLVGLDKSFEEAMDAIDEFRSLR